MRLEVANVLMQRSVTVLHTPGGRAREFTHLVRRGPFRLRKVLVEDTSLRGTLEAEGTVIRLDGCETRECLAGQNKISRIRLCELSEVHTRWTASFSSTTKEMI
jgi:hypothetical protein